MDNLPIQLLRPVLQVTHGWTAPEINLRVGDLLQGTVLSLLGENTATVRLGGMELVASISQPLQAGEEITVRVEQLAPQFIVRLIRQEPQAQDRLSALFRLYLPQKMPLEETLRHLTQMLSAAPANPSTLQEALGDLELLLRTWAADPPPGDPSSSALPPGRDLQAQLQRSGIFYESKLAEWIAQGKEEQLPTVARQDLKGALLKLDQRLDEELARLTQPGHPPPEQTLELSRAVKGLLANLELNQLTNQWASEHGGWMLYPLPAGKEADFSSIRLYVHRDPEKEKGTDRERPDYFRLVLMLEPRNLGPLRVDLSVLGKQLSVQLYVLSEGTRNFLAPWLSELTAALGEAGFEGRVEARTADAGFLTQRLEEAPAEERPLGLLNVRV
ncbi:MAG: flagellar hook-length control protein FliK [Candidatus Tectomicrobia bacterium]|uniref:Flagellar hook-length control protein FliK n=1 Tax=Tectimicrobiota bacterium TaxID=2528274 RepID=A0A932CQZ8_UNCTE|nr:flagellar hook-length control protein FliK [Candidatus Tectomicrobia bacterium]